MLVLKHTHETNIYIMLDDCPRHPRVIFEIHRNFSRLGAPRGVRNHRTDCSCWSVELTALQNSDKLPNMKGTSFWWVLRVPKARTLSMACGVEVLKLWIFEEMFMNHMDSFGKMVELQERRRQLCDSDVFVFPSDSNPIPLRFSALPEWHCVDHLFTHTFRGASDGRGWICRSRRSSRRICCFDSRGNISPQESS